MPNTSNSPTENLVGKLVGNLAGDIADAGAMIAQQKATSGRKGADKALIWAEPPPVPPPTSEKEWDQHNHTGGTAQAAPAGTAQAHATWPPGQVGQLAQYFYNQSQYPNQQIGIVAAFNFMAGISGLRWQTPTKAGTNLFLILVAASGMGKEPATEAPHSLFVKALKELGSHISLENPFYTGTLSSKQGLLKLLAKKRSLAKGWNEIGSMFKNWNKPNDPVSSGLKEALLIIYPKSAHDSTLGGMAYSNEADVVEDPGPCALTVIGDVTPTELFPAIDPNAATDGGLSRMDFVQATGARPYRNEWACCAPPPNLMEWAKALITHADHLNRSEKFVFVGYEDAKVKEMLDAFEKRSTDLFNNHPEGFIKQLHTRAYLKVIKYASLLAVADNPYSPVITTAHARWAIQFSEQQIKMFKDNVEAGDVGAGDAARQNMAFKYLRAYLAKRPPASYGVTDKMYEARLIPLSYIGRATSGKSAFKDHPMGANFALKQTLNHMVACGHLYKLDKAELMANGYAPQSELYRIMGLDHRSE